MSGRRRAPAGHRWLERAPEAFPLVSISRFVCGVVVRDNPSRWCLAASSGVLFFGERSMHKAAISAVLDEATRKGWEP